MISSFGFYLVFFYRFQLFASHKCIQVQVNAFPCDSIDALILICMAFGMNNWPKSALLLELATIGLDRSILNCMRFSYFAKSVLWVNLNNIILVYIFSALRVRWKMIASNSVSSNNLITWYWEMKWIWQLNGIKLNAPPFAVDYELFIFQFYQQAQQLFAHVSSISIYGRGYRGHESKAFVAEKLQRENNQNFLICRYGKIDLLTISSSLESVSVCVAVGYDTSADLLVDWLFAFGCSMLQLNTTRPFCTSALELTRGRDVDDDRLRVITSSSHQQQQQ